MFASLLGCVTCTQCRRCSLLLQMSYTAWSVCLVCLCVFDIYVPCQSGWTDQYAIWGLIYVSPRNHLLDGVEIHPREAAISGSCLASWKAVGASAVVYAAKGIVQ